MHCIAHAFQFLPPSLTLFISSLPQKRYAPPRASPSYTSVPARKQATKAESSPLDRGWRLSPLCQHAGKLGGRSSVSAGHAQRARMISNHLDGYEQTSQHVLITRTFSTSVLHFPTKAFSPSLFVRVGWPLVPPPLSADRGPYALAPTSK